MVWVYSALIAAFFNALMDFFVKVSSGKIHNALGGVILTGTAALTMAGISLFYRSKGEVLNITWQGGIASMLARVSVGIATLFIYRMFDSHANLSIAIPFLRICIILFSVALGVLVLKEHLGLRSVAGIVIALFGLFLILSPVNK